MGNLPRYGWEDPIPERDQPSVPIPVLVALGVLVVVATVVIYLRMT
jgi:hypothetical protein